MKEQLFKDGELTDFGKDIKEDFMEYIGKSYFEKYPYDKIGISDLLVVSVLEVEIESIMKEKTKKEE